MKTKLFIECIFLIIIGIVTSLSLPPFNFFIINFITFPLFFLFLKNKLKQNKNYKFFFLYGWLFGFGYFISNLYWISISLTFDKNFEFLIPFTIFLIPAFLSIFYGLASSLFSSQLSHLRSIYQNNPFDRREQLPYYHLVRLTD